jgi:hypothetical protein
MPALETNAGAVAVRNARAPEFDVLDQHLGVAHHPQRLAFGAGPIGKQQRALADAANGQPALRPDHRLLPILAGQDLDGVAVTRHARGLGDAPDLFLRADDDGPAVCRGARHLLVQNLRLTAVPADRRAIGRRPDDLDPTLFVATNRAQLNGCRGQIVGQYRRGGQNHEQRGGEASGVDHFPPWRWRWRWPDIRVASRGRGLR